jgi:ribosomal protein L7/L12
MSEFSKYESLKSRGIGALDAYLSAKRDGVDQIASIRMLRAVYGLSLEEAKKVSFQGDTGQTYEEQEGKSIEEFTKILDEFLGPPEDVGGTRGRKP